MWGGLFFILGIDARAWRHSVQSAKWDSVDCVSMWWYIYKYYYCFLICWGNRPPIYVPLIPSSPSISLSLKNRSDATGGCPNPFVTFLNIFFLCFKEKSISVCITVLYYILILIVHFSKSMYKQFAENNTPSAHISKYQIFHPQLLFKPFSNNLSTLKVTTK